MMESCAGEYAVAEYALVACHDCDLLFRKPRLRPGQKARCPRCGAVLFQRKRSGMDQSLALACTSLVLFILANAYPLLRMNIAGRVQEGSLLTGIEELYSQGYWEISVLVFVVTFLAPLAKMLCLFYVLLPLWLFGRRAPKAERVFRWMEQLSPWAMTEVFMLGILVAVVKLADLAALTPGIALYSFAGLMVTMAAGDAMLDDHEVWERLEAADG
ncbi:MULTISPECIES: paraquat-inducible protein A [Methylococcus]|uniref:Paraquat-inducible protein A n=1 Tax=Methylococcus capsulatus TaxID=414 RepID=A0ABZ2F878_METCP|nr:MULTISPECIES: paraquat-inducible protein A [Methylococcus]MDF9390986.1 paraquat-inducible protein A [Methylococcus capsulatus]